MIAPTFYRALFGYQPGRMTRVLAVVLLACLAEGFGLLLLAPLIRLMGASGPGSQPPLGLAADTSLLLLLAVFAAVGVLRALLIRQRDIALSEIQIGYANHLRQRLYAAIADMEWLELTRTRRSDLLQALTGDVARVGMATRLSLELIGTVLLVAVYLAVAFLLAPALTSVALVAVAVLAPFSVPQLRRSAAHGLRLTESNRRQFATAAEFLDGIKLAKSYGRTGAHVDAFGAALREEQAVWRAFDRARATSNGVQQVVTMAALAAGGWLGSAVFHLHPVRLLPLILVLSRLFPALTRLSQSGHRLASLLPAYTSLAALTARCEGAAEGFVPARIGVPRQRCDIRLERVEVRYRPEGNPALDRVDVHIAACATTAIVGLPARGKSTLADLVLGLLTPSAGRVLVGGEPLLPGPVLSAWRRRVAYVQQDTFLFADSVAANLRWAVPTATDAEIWRALRQAAAAEVVERLPSGLATQLGDRGVRLSGGERQRLALARALLRQPAVLILDEATSSLDNENEAAIQAALDQLRGELTLIVIAHRLSTVRNADLVVVLDAGRVAESGSWANLADRPGGRLSALASSVRHPQPVPVLLDRWVGS